MKNIRYFRFLILVILGGIVFFYKVDNVFEFNKNIIKKDNAINYVIQEENVAFNSLDNADGSSEGQNNSQETFFQADLNSSNSDGTNENNMDNAVNTQLTFVDVEDDYFDDALFIGDSRIVGLYDYSGWENATFCCSSGMRLDGFFGEPNTKFKDGNWTENISEMLKKKSFNKVYLMLGINDMGVGDLNYFFDNYKKVVDYIREYQPNAIIYIQSIMSVTRERSEHGDYITNEAIFERNELLKQLHNGVDTIYLDVNSALCDETGALNAEYTFDGVHLYAQYIYIWTDYLKSHGILK